MNLKPDDAGCAVFASIIAIVVIIAIVCFTIIVVTGHGGIFTK